MADDILASLAAQAQRRFNSSDYNGAVENLISINTKLVSPNNFYLLPI